MATPPSPTDEDIGFTFDDVRKATPARPTEDVGFTFEDVRRAPGSADNYTGGLVRRAADDLLQTGRDLRSGLLGSVAGLDHTTANLFMVLDRASQWLSETTGLSRGGAFGELERYYRREAGLLSEKSKEGAGTGIGSKINQLIGGLPVGLATAGAATVAGGPVAGLGALGALDRADQGLEAAVKGGIGGAALGKVFNVTTGAGRLARFGTVGSAAAGIEAAQGATPEEALTAGATTGLLAAIPAPSPTAIGPRDFLKSAVNAKRTLAARRLTRIKERLETERAGRIVRGEERVGLPDEVSIGEPPLVSMSAPRMERVNEILGTPLPTTEPVPRKVVNLNLDRVKGPEDFKRLQAKLTEEFKSEIDVARRGVITHEQTAAMAEELGFTFKDLMKRRHGQAFNPEEITAARTLHQAIVKDLYETAKRVRDPQAKLDPAKLDADKLQLMKLATMFDLSAQQVLGATAEAGRTLSAMRILAGPTTADLRTIRQAVKGLEASTRGAEVETFADMIVQLETPRQLSTFMRKSAEATTAEKLLEVWINGLLSSPRTQIVNVLSNTATALWSVPEAYLGGMSGTVRSGINKLRGHETPDRVFIREGNARVHGFLEGTRDGLKLAGKAFATGEATFDPLSSKLEIPRQAANRGAFGEFVRIPGRFLVAGDEFFKVVGYRQELRARAVRSAAGEGLKGRAYHERVAEILNDPPAAMREAALDHARSQTFTKPLGPTGQALLDLADSHPSVRLILPFVRTPTNILKYAASRTPLGFLMREEVVRPLRRGGAEADMVMGRLTFAAGVAGLVAAEVAKGNITGAGPRNPEARAVWLASGRRPYSFKIGDNYVSYSRIEPLASLVGVNADLAEIMGQIDDPEMRDKLASEIVFAHTRNFTNKTYVLGLSRAFLALSDPERYGENFVQRLGSSVVPTGVADIARFRDPVLRDADGLIESIKSRLPEYSKDVPPRRNIWGVPLYFDKGIGPDAISPLYQNELVPDLATQEAHRVGARFGKPDQTYQWDIGGEKVKIELDHFEYDALLKLIGERAKRGVDKLVTSPGYETIPDSMKRRVMERIYDVARDASRAEMLAILLRENPGRLSEPALRVLETLRKETTPP